MKTIVAPGSGRYCECPRTLRLVTLMPPELASSGLALVLPRHVSEEPDPESDDYWDEVASVVESIPSHLLIKSESIEQLQQRLIPKLQSEQARVYAQSIILRLFFMSLLEAPRARLGLFFSMQTHATRRA
jgi:hypothetical protein